MGLELACSNYSRDSLSTDLWTLLNPFEKIALGVGIVCTIFMLIGVPWNLLVIVTVLRKHLFLQPAILLLLNLAITDFLLCLVALPYNAVPAIANEFIFGNTDYVRCQFCQVGFIYTLLLLMSVYNVALLSLDRFLYVKKPLKYEKIVTVKRVSVVLLICWLLFTVFSLLPIFGVGQIALGEVVSTCTVSFDFETMQDSRTNYVYLLVFIMGASILPAIILIVTNIWMLCIIRISIMKGYHRATENSGNRGSLNLLVRKHIRLVQVFGAIFCANIFTWVPTFISIVMIAANVIVPWFIALGHLSLLSQAVIHPILQVVMLKDIRVEITRPYYYFKHQCSSPRNESGREETVSGGVLRRFGETLDKWGTALVNYHSQTM